MNLADVLILAAVALLVALAVRHTRRRTKKGCSCCGGCAKSCCGNDTGEKAARCPSSGR